MDALGDQAVTAVRVGPRSTEQLARLSRVWRQGEHVLISGGTGSGKTTLARHLDEIRYQRGGHVMVMVCKPGRDDTIRDEYKGFTRWEKWRNRVSANDRKILLWPDTKGLPPDETLKIQREVFGEALDKLFHVGKFTLHIDEGYYASHPSFLGFGDKIAMLHATGRSNKLTLMTLVQRPSNIPLIIYGSVSHAFIGRTREATDTKRLAELGGRESAKELGARIDVQGKRDFLWIPVAPDWPAEPFNLRS